jgi:tRNA-binding EMAP/Myf-like protein
MAYNAYVFQLKQDMIHPHPNADKLVLVKVYDTQCIVSKDMATQIDQWFVFFPEGGQLSLEYAAANHLLRPEGFLEPQKRNVKTIRLRGEISEGLIMPLGTLAPYFNIAGLGEGDAVGEPVCHKYIPHTQAKPQATLQQKPKKKKEDKNTQYVFPQHIDTAQLKFNLPIFKEGDTIMISEKLEGTSGRSGYLPVYKTNWLRRFLRLEPRIEYRYFCGSRRVEVVGADSGFYGDNAFRLDIHKQLQPYLTPGLEVFYEVVGWPAAGAAPLMGTVDTTCLHDKQFTQTYGERMVFDYGCEEGTYDFYIYRIAQFDVDGRVVKEYSTDEVREWAALYGFKTVPVLWRGKLGDKPQEEIVELANFYCDGESTLGHHLREGCIVRRETEPNKWQAFKHKNDYYKIMKGLYVEKLANTEGIAQDILEEL